MSPTWRRGTTPVGHPVVFRGIGSPGRYEAAMEYTECLGLRLTTSFSLLEKVGLSRQPPSPQADACRIVSSPSVGAILPTTRGGVPVPEDRVCA
jgi:hypothetical protein